MEAQPHCWPAFQATQATVAETLSLHSHSLMSSGHWSSGGDRQCYGAEAALPAHMTAMLSPAAVGPDQQSSTTAQKARGSFCMLAGWLVQGGWVEKPRASGAGRGKRSHCRHVYLLGEVPPAGGERGKAGNTCLQRIVWQSYFNDYVDDVASSQAKDLVSSMVALELSQFILAPIDGCSGQ